ncbi:glycerophosphodiester phosphodiesterase domain-containing protein 4 isoform X1 [Amblyraja radiata]|uniref:glycerophosphodiester phosphodiesterase domain-containing protein 4 isoform X1 n=1 Tax=Amblyraja radiata TaxID=386614 RepID=UPI0014038FB7|nr:glycerophosphodiester phosphodiesterase domain-containing protein 4 isoform X1 [Amblyraja radiata]XP_032879271.1 glycerophosphodiester phosphodiesterase domain-containing protein 4 isoform X1 [Amblyraja radiata]
MGSTPIQLTKVKLGKLQVVRRHLLQRYESQPFLSCLAGLYGCQWRRYQRTRFLPGEFCCNKFEMFSFGILVLTFALAFVLLYFWSEAKNDYNDFDWNFYRDRWFPWSAVVLGVTVTFFTYIAILLVLAICLLSESQRLYLFWGHKIATVLVFAFSAVAIGFLYSQWQEEWNTFIISFQVTAPYLHVGGVAVLTTLSWPVAQHFSKMTGKVARVITLGLYLAALLFLYLVPLGMYSSCIKERGTLGPKPAIIGHRGAPMLAPENTLMSFEKTIEHGGDGLETDVTISLDGVPFLLHDPTLKRTTDIEEVFPGNHSRKAAFFPWHQLAQLNAGKWFLEDNPFGTKRLLSAADRWKAGRQGLCKLTDLLTLASTHSKLVIFDLYRPPRSHPYRDSFIKQTISAIQDSGIKQNLILWLPNPLRPIVQQKMPGFIHIYGGKQPVRDLQMDRITRINVRYSELSHREIRMYSAANISTNLYVVTEPWIFSLAWCSGAHSVITNDPQRLRELGQPCFLMTPFQYKAMWVSSDIVSAMLVMLIFIFHWWRENGFACHPSVKGRDKGIYSKFRTEMNNVWSVSEAEPIAIQPSNNTASLPTSAVPGHV